MKAADLIALVFILVRSKDKRIVQSGEGVRTEIKYFVQ